ncbi:MAG: acyl-CoA thioesterase [Roseiarcus sp.]
MALVETYRGVVFPWLADQMRHLTTSRYLEMFDVGSYHLAHRLGLAYDASTNMGLADVRHEIDYKAEAPVGALVLIRSGVVSVGRTSFRARHVMTDADVKRVHAVLEAVCVRFDLASRKAIELPDDFRARAASVMADEEA